LPVRVSRIDRLQTRLAETGMARLEREHDLAGIVLNVVDRDAVMGGDERGEFCRAREETVEKDADFIGPRVRRSRNLER
jgi:hypothetical protein